MSIIKSTARGPAFCKSVVYGFYTAQAMNRLIIVFVSGEEWSTSATVTKINYQAANLIPISLVESSNFWCKLYHRVKIFFKV